MPRNIVMAQAIFCVWTPDGEWRLLAEQSVLCWTRQHMPMYLLSWLATPVLLVLYPALIVMYINRRDLKERIGVGEYTGPRPAELRKHEKRRFGMAFLSYKSSYMQKFLHR